MKRRSLLSLSAALATTIATRTPVWAQDRPLRLVVPYAAGGGVDVQARALAVPLGKALSRSVVVVNLVGGNTLIATDNVRRSPPDGGSILLMPAVAWIGFHASGTFSYEPWKTLLPIGQIADAPYNFLQTKVGSGLDSWEKVRAYAKRTPGGIKIGGPSSGGFIGFTVNEIFRRGGIDGVYAPFAGASPAHVALLSGTVDMTILSFGDGMINVTSGATHGIALSSPQRHTRAPQVPTFTELGIGETLQNTFSLWAPPDTPADMVANIAGAVRTATGDSAFRSTMEERLSFTVAFKDGGAVSRDLEIVERDWGARLKAAK
jgi:tripartite-type tricarboxylate transporter receptor subunit TctC